MLTVKTKKMTLYERIKIFSTLGALLRDHFNFNTSAFDEELNTLIEKQYFLNPWFTPANVRFAINSIAKELTVENLTEWTSRYPALAGEISPVRVAVIMAGNIPLVGFHDFLSVLISGNRIIAKASSKDSELIKYMAALLCRLEPRFNEYIEFNDGMLNEFDAIIATGSDNSSRYFDYYFGKYPNIIRKNRNSVAIVSGEESNEEIDRLGDDIFSYFGLGCRNISKIYLPSGYDLAKLFIRWESLSDVINHSKYGNNYDFNKAIYLVNREPFLDTGFLLLREDHHLHSPVAVLHYQFYNSPGEVAQELVSQSEKIQCVVGKGNIAFGNAQSPKLWDYADGIDTLEFLQKK